MPPKRTSLTLCLTLLAAGCGGKSDEEKRVTHTGLSGINLYLAGGSQNTATVYGGPIPGDSWTVAQSPVANGYVLLGTASSGVAPTVVSIPAAYPYFLIKVKYGTIDTVNDKSVRIDAVQRTADGMYMTGRTNSAYTFYSTGIWDQDKLFGTTPAGDGYWVGPPDGKYMGLYGWALLPSADWAP